MGELLKRSSKGAWQRRWVVLDGEAQALHYLHSPGDKPARAFSLRGAVVMRDVPAPGESSRWALVGDAEHPKCAEHASHVCPQLLPP